MTESEYNKILSNLKGTFAIEGIELSEKALHNLHRIAFDGVDYERVLEEIKVKYTKRDKARRDI